MEANDVLNLIPFCIAMGEAAGTAAAFAIKNHVSPRQVDHKIIQKRLIERGGVATEGITVISKDRGKAGYFTDKKGISCNKQYRRKNTPLISYKLT
jgi:hypothetical protein